MQTIWKGDEAATNALYRCAVTSKSGLVRTQDVAEALNDPNWGPELPAWVQAWIEAEETRDWPPAS